MRILGNDASGGHPEMIDSPTPTWRNLPNKGQLAILALSRFVDFFQMTALQTYMVHQLQSFDPSLPQTTIAYQAGVLQGSFTAAQIITSILWGRVADHPSFGRKTVLNIGLIGTGIGCAGVGFSKSFGQAVTWRLLSGAINGTVGTARTMVAECTPRPWHARAFLLLPVAFNLANVTGPLFASLLIAPYLRMSSIFGQQSLFGGETGVLWMRERPFALANLLSTVLLFMEAVLVHYGLRETLATKRDMVQDAVNPLRVLHSCYTRLFDRFKMSDRSSLVTAQQNEALLANVGDGPYSEGRASDMKRDNGMRALSFGQLWTPNLIWTLLSIAFFDFHMGAFASLWTLFLAAPRLSTPDDGGEQLSGQRIADLHSRNTAPTSSGLGFSPFLIGNSMAILGSVGVLLQVLLYPKVNQRFGLLRCFRWSLLLFPVAYLLAPLPTVLPSDKAPPAPASGFYVWAGICAVLILQVSARTFAMPASIILLNNASPHPSVLGTVHGLGNACSAAFRTLGPMVVAMWYRIGVATGVAQMAWWLVALVAAIGCVASYRLKNGADREILPVREAVEMRPRECTVSRLK
jgi:MFS family permease